MTGNVALDVAIGLTFTYVLYSLFATVLMEIIITAIGLRAWNLQFSIYQKVSSHCSLKRLLVQLTLILFLIRVSIASNQYNIKTVKG